jgi:hypothetical protein
LSAYEQNGKRSDSLAYATCRIDDTDTWLITSSGKVKNKQSGKCLSAATGQDSLVLVHCNYMHFRDHTAHDFIIFDDLVNRDSDGVEVADVRF